MPLFVDALYLALLPCLTWTFGVRPGTADRRVPPIGVALGLALALIRKLTNWVNNEFLLLGLFGVGVALAICWAARPNRWIGAGMTLVLALTSVPDIALAALAIIPNNETLFGSVAGGNLIGYAAGLVLPVLICWAGHRCLAIANRRMVVWLQRVVLGVWITAALVTLAKVLLGRRILPSLPGLFDLIAFLTNNAQVLSWLALAAMLAAAFTAKLSAGDPPAPTNPAQARIQLAGGISRRRFLTTSATGSAIVLLGGTLGRRLAITEVALSPPEEWSDAGNNVAVALDQVDDRHLHRFAYQTKTGTEVRFIVIRKNAQAYGVGLDACNVCGPTGYFERNGQVICKLCDVAMNIQTIGFMGGCNPIPLAYTVAEGKMLVAKADLEEAGKVFS
jgi:uncharacterized membrane protein